MKCIFALLVLIPLAYCATVDEKRFWVNSFNKDALVQQLVNLLGSDTSEKACHTTVNHVGGVLKTAESLFHLCHLAIQQIKQHLG